jgi:hypothetical protein
MSVEQEGVGEGVGTSGRWYHATGHGEFRGPGIDAQEGAEDEEGTY